MGATDGNVIDSLSIQIGASVDKSIDAIKTLQDQLAKLNSALENFTDTGKYKTALDNMANGFQSISDAVSNLDTDRIKDAASALRSFSKATENIESAFKTVTKYSNTLEDSVSGVLTEVFEEYGIKGEENISRVTRKFIELRNVMAADDRTTEKTNAAFDSTISEIQELSNVTREATDSYHGLLDAIRAYHSKGSKIHIEKGSGSEYRDGELLGMLSSMGGAKYFTTGKGTVDFQEFAKDIIDQIGHGLIPEHELPNSGAGGYEVWLHEFAEACRVAREEERQMQEGGEKIRVEYDEVAQSVVNNLNRVFEAVRSFNQSGQKVEESPLTKMGDVLKGLDGIQIPDMSNLESLAKSAQKLGDDKSSKAGENIPKIADGLRTLDGVNVPDYSGLSGLAALIHSLGNTVEGRGTENLPKIAEGLAELSFVQIPDFTGIDSLASAMSTLGGANTKKAAENIPNLTQALNDLLMSLNAMPEVSDKTLQLITALGNLNASNMRAATSSGRASTNIKQMGTTGKFVTKIYEHYAQVIKNCWNNTNTFKSGITTAENTVKSLGNAVLNAGKNFLDIPKHLGQVKQSVSNLGVAFIKLRGIIWGFKMIGNMFSGLVENASSLTEVQNVIRHVYDPTYINEFSEACENTITTLGMSKLTFQQFASRYQAMGRALGITNGQMSEAEDHLKSLGIEYGTMSGKMGDMSVNLTRLAGDMASFYDVDVSSVYQSLQAVYTGQTRPLILAA